MIINTKFPQIVIIAWHNTLRTPEERQLSQQRSNDLSPRPVVVRRFYCIQGFQASIRVHFIIYTGILGLNQGAFYHLYRDFRRRLGCILISIQGFQASLGCILSSIQGFQTSIRVHFIIYTGILGLIRVHFIIYTGILGLIRVHFIIYTGILGLNQGAFYHLYRDFRRQLGCILISIQGFQASLGCILSSIQGFQASIRVHFIIYTGILGLNQGAF